VSAIDRLRTAPGNRYTTGRELDGDGMATVYLEHDIKHDRKVAIKVARDLWRPGVYDLTSLTISHSIWR
jgi:hypothetical protein